MRGLHLHGLTDHQATTLAERSVSKASPGCDAPVPTSLWPAVVASPSSSSDELFTSDEDDDAADDARTAASLGLPSHHRQRHASFASGYTQKSFYSNHEEQKLFPAAASSSAGDSSSEMGASVQLPTRPKPIKTKAKFHSRRQHTSTKVSKKTQDTALTTPPPLSPKSNTTSSWSSPPKSASREEHRLSYPFSPSSPKRDWRYQVCLSPCIDTCISSLRL